MDWHVVHTKPGREWAAAELLRRPGIEVYAPKLAVRRLRGGGYARVVEPLFPCYVFARFDPEVHLWMITYTRGIRRVLGGPEGPWTVPGELIDAIRSRESEEGLITVRDPGVEEGDRVRVADGPFAGVEAVLKRYVPGSERAVVLVDALGCQARVVLERVSLVRVG